METDPESRRGKIVGEVLKDDSLIKTVTKGCTKIKEFQVLTFEVRDASETIYSIERATGRFRLAHVPQPTNPGTDDFIMNGINMRV